MGLIYEQFVILASLAKGGFLSGKSCLMLGRQNNFLRRSSMKRVSKHVGIEFSDSCVEEFLSGRFIEPILYRFGAKSADSIDASNYEDANIVADMNQPIPKNLIGKYDFLYDGGTLEHIYNYPQAIRNVSDLLNTGGILFSTSPANNEPGHGFYQFSSELISSAFPKNGIEIMAIYLVAARFPSQFYDVSWLANIGERITFLSGEPIQIFVVARKSERRQDNNLVLQSDYR